LLRLDIIAGNNQPVLKAAQFNIIPGNFRQQADQHITAIFLGCCNVSFRRFDRPVHPTKDVEFPASIKAGLKKITLLAYAK
jgi:hypothetical protein